MHHEFYVINIKLGETAATRISSSDRSSSRSSSGRLEVPEVRLTQTFIYQTGGFTIVWLCMKTLVMPFVLAIMCWYWSRIVRLERRANLLERVLFALGIALTMFNLPVEWLTLYFDMSWMLLYTDLRQG